MTKKHFIALAAALREVAAHPRNDSATHVACCHAIADAAEAFNPRFDRAKFLKACIPGDARSQT